MGKETELIKQKLPIAEFIRSYLQLSPAGKNFKALCPFHSEKTPSFIVSPERNTWHCFGCGEGGDIFSFVMRYENIEFPEALRFLAERAGVPLRTLSPTQQREFGILYDMHADATKFFTEHLKKNPAATEYLQKRGLKKETIEEFSIGFAPGGDSLVVHLLKNGYDINDVARAGLAFKNNHGLFRDRFENRIIFPLFNSTGKIVAFTGRILGGETDATPKYVNSPETPIFTKSKILYGFSHAKRAIAETHTAFLVEGQMDFLMAWQSGIPNAIAVSGTALTKEHLEKLRRFADTVIVSFDNDSAGFKALERAIELFGSFDFFVKAISLGEYKDPADACEKDPQFLKNALTKASPAFEMLLDHYFPEDFPRDVPLTKRIVRHLLEKVARIESPLERERWVREMVKKTGISEQRINEELEMVAEELSKKKNGDKNAEISEKKEKEEISRTRIISERLLLLAFTDPDFSSILKSSYKEIIPKEYISILDGTVPENDRIALLRMKASYEFSGIPKEKMREEFDELVRQLSLETLKKKRDDLRRDIQKAEYIKDERKVTESIKEFHEISRKINELQKNVKKTN